MDTILLIIRISVFLLFSVGLPVLGFLYVFTKNPKIGAACIALALIFLFFISYNNIR